MSTSFPEGLAQLARNDDQEQGTDPLVAKAQYQLLRDSLNDTQMFLGKRFQIVWPDGEPPALTQVLNILASGW